MPRGQLTLHLIGISLLWVPLFRPEVESTQKWSHGAEPGAAQSQHFSGLWTRRAARVSLGRRCCCSCSRSLQVLLEAACSQLFISGLCVCLLNSLQPTDWYRQPSPVWELAEPCDFPHKGSVAGSQSDFQPCWWHQGWVGLKPRQRLRAVQSNLP